MDARHSKVSIIIPCYNAKKTISDCLAGLKTQEYPLFEIIVVDDCSTDGTYEILKGISGIRLIRNTENHGPAYSRNRAAKESTGEILLLIDSDCMIDDSRLIAKHVLAHGDDAVHICGGGIQGVGAGCVAKADNYIHWFLNIPNSDNRVRTHLVTNNMSIKKEVFERLGGFNIQLRTGEDTDFCERALKAGYRLGLRTDAIVKHCDRERFKDFFRNFYLVGIDRIPARKAQKHRYWYLLPQGLLSSLLYCLPLAFVLTVQVVLAWMPYDKKVILYAPIIYLGRFAMTWGIVSYYFHKSTGASKNHCTVCK